MNCEGCPVRNDIIGGLPNPMPSESFNVKGGVVDVLIVGHAPNKGASSPFQGVAGGTLRKHLKALKLGAVITNLHRCRLPSDSNYANSQPGKYCKEALIRDLQTFRPPLVVSVGSQPAQVLTASFEPNGKVKSGKSSYQLDGLTETSWNYITFKLLAFPHLSAIQRISQELEERCWRQLEARTEGGS